MEYIVTTVLLVIIAILTIAHAFIHQKKSGKVINKIPGPRTWPLFGNAPYLVGPPETLWETLRKWADDYYPIYKLWIGHLPTVNLRHPDDAEALFSGQESITKSIFYDLLHPWLNEGLLTSNGSKWRERRKALTPAFNYNVLKASIGVFVEVSERMVDTLKKENGKTVDDLVPFFSKFMLTAICESAMGTALREDDPLQDAYIRNVKLVGNAIYYRAVRPWLLNDWIFSLTHKGRLQAKALNVIHRFTEKIIQTRKKYHEGTGERYLKERSESERSSEAETYGKRLALLDLLIAIQKANVKFADLDIREEVDTFLFEGHDTTEMVLSFTMVLLAERKEIQERARNEIDSVLKDSNGKLSINELKNLPYLDCCIKESLRMFPPVPLISRKITTDIHLKNFRVPRGTILNFSIFDLHRDPNFWPQPHVYDPNRFLPNEKLKRHPYSFIPFGGGPRNCIGQKYAMLKLKAFVGLILNNFKLEPVTELANIRMAPELVLRPVNPLKVKFVPLR